MIALWIFLTLLFIFLGYIVVLCLRRLNRYEEVLIEIDDYIKYASQKLKIIDDRGSFEADDEIGFFFGYIKELQQSIANLIGQGENDNDQSDDRINSVE